MYWVHLPLTKNLEKFEFIFEFIFEIFVNFEYIFEVFFVNFEFFVNGRWSRYEAKNNMRRMLVLIGRLWSARSLKKKDCTFSHTTAHAPVLSLHYYISFKLHPIIARWHWWFETMLPKTWVNGCNMVQLLKGLTNLSFLWCSRVSIPFWWDLLERNLK